MDVGDDADIRPGCVFGSTDISIGRATFVNVGCIFDGSAAISIGDRCSIGFRAQLVTTDHRRGPHEQRAVGLVPKPVVIEDGVWIGSQVVVLPGVTVGAGSIVGANAVVHRDVPRDSVVAGVPARVIRQLHSEDGGGPLARNG